MGLLVGLKCVFCCLDAIFWVRYRGLQPLMHRDHASVRLLPTVCRACRSQERATMGVLNLCLVYGKGEPYFSETQSSLKELYTIRAVSASHQTSTIYWEMK